MIQLNLLPDVKLEYIKAERSRRFVTSIAVIVSLVAVGILILISAINILQKKHLNDLSTDITKAAARLQNEPDINRILTVQNQLGSLTNLHASKPAASRLLNYLNQVTPTKIAISNLDINFAEHTATITGTADTLSSVNQYVDTLKFTTYSVADKDTKSPAFTNVVLGGFGLANSSSNGKPANYTITLTYEPVIFDITKNVTLTVPSQTSTRSVNQSADLFEEAPANAIRGNN